ncbi:hypothetical protein H0H92_005323 [Tricholoma furcatifolium]|nr:hypothetical protein H0H92_005323 [Tricholoma furcatifolium]
MATPVSGPPSDASPYDSEKETAYSTHDGSRETFWTKITAGAAEGNQTKRGMQSRHLMMIAIGGTIGTGIFLSAGSAIAVAGPGSALLSYLVVGIFVYSVVITLGEMSTMFPVTGAFSHFGSRFISPALGFTLGWNFWLGWTLTIPSELTAAAVILQYWTLTLQPWHWALIIIVPVFFFQLIHVRAYAHELPGESEYWLSLIKVLLIIVFILVGLIFDWGGIKHHPGPGLANFHEGQAFVGGFGAFAQTFVYAFYSFGGIELVAVAAGESVKPHRSVPRAVKATFFRILFFYILTILTIGLCINYRDPTLLTAASDSSVAASPVTVVFLRAGFGAGVHVVNAVLLTAVLSATNSCFYASSRILLALAQAGQAPRVFGWVNRRGVPVPALMVTLSFAFLSFLTTIWGAGVVFTWLLNITGISSLLVWTSVGVMSLRFRHAYAARGLSLKDLPYRQPLYPLLPIFVISLGTLMFIALGYAAVRQQPFDAKNIVATYIGISTYIILYAGYSFYEWRWGSNVHWIPTEDIDFHSDAVWQPGEGDIIREQDKQEAAQLHSLGVSGRKRAMRWFREHIY